MDIEKLNNYKINESNVLNETDKRHIENYKQLISFFEGAIHKSIKEGSADYNALHMSCIQCIRHLDNLISSYDQTVLGAKLVNQTIDKIINENTPLNPSTKKDLGNDQS